MSDSQNHTLIVGAGLSGTTCARKLAQAGGRGGDVNFDARLAPHPPLL